MRAQISCDISLDIRIYCVSNVKCWCNPDTAAVQVVDGSIHSRHVDRSVYPASIALPSRRCLLVVTCLQWVCCLSSCTGIVTFLIVVVESQASVFRLRRPAVNRLMTRVAGTCGGVAISLATTEYHLQQSHTAVIGHSCVNGDQPNSWNVDKIFLVIF